MKIRNRSRRLQARQASYDVMIKKHPELATAHKRPGSLKK